ncbi:hypothetical protein C6P40_004402 [Pichia californica]|uniref:Uncharacterized protein n=1 Tax=Pichia californica TaxID=460514 RepID=A0A9P6WGD2_9ASCO|nr:hypothetical protein C6P40_004402 [[Candida] californica]
MNYLTGFSKEEKIEIQKKLTIYDNTLKSTLDAIKNGKLNNNTIPTFQDLPSDKVMNQILKSVDSNNIKKIVVDSNVSVSIDISPSSSTTTTTTRTTASTNPKNRIIAKPSDKQETNILSTNKPSNSSSAELANNIVQNQQFQSSPQNQSQNKSQIDYNTNSNDNKSVVSADEYIKQMQNIITTKNGNKKFDSFSENIMKTELLSSKTQDQIEIPQNGKVTLEYDKNGHLISTGTTEDILKNKINSQIVKALESFKLDDNLEEDIAHAIAKSFDNNQHFNIDDKSLQILTGEKGLSFDSFTSQLKQYKKRYLEQIEDQSKAIFSDAINAVKDKQNIDSSKINSENIKDIKKPINNVKNIQKQEFSNSRTKKGPNLSFEMCTEPTLEQKEKMQRECLERLRMQDLQLDENASKSKKKKNKKKKRNSSILASGAGLNYLTNNSDAWLCELCEYKIVYGEVPIFLTEWLQKKANHQEKMESYQRYLMEQRKGNMHTHHSQCDGSCHMHNREDDNDYVNDDDDDDDDDDDNDDDNDNDNGDDDNDYHQRHHYSHHGHGYDGHECSCSHGFDENEEDEDEGCGSDCDHHHHAHS